MTSSLYNEKLADQEVIKNLLKEIRRLKGEFKMSDVRKDENGALLVLHNFETVTLERAKEIVGKLRDDLAVFEAFIADEEAKAANPAPADPAQASDAPAQPETPAAPDAQAAPATDLTSDAPAAPVDPAPAVAQPPAPEAPITDPGGNPITLQ